MLIFVITPIFPSIHNKQQGIYVFEQCKALSRKGNRVVVLNISAVRWNKWHTKACREIHFNREEGIDTVTLNPRGILASKLPRYATISAWQVLKKIYKEAVKKYGKP